MIRYRYWAIAFVVLALVALPLVIAPNAEFTGTDDNAVTVIQTIDNSYLPWFNGVQLFDSSEITSMFFALQAAIGAGVLGYYIGYSRGKLTNKGN